MAIRLNGFERAFAVLRPAWGAQRLADRMAFAELQELARGYEMARRGRRTEGWHATGGSPNAEAFPAIGITVRRSRDLCRNNEWARNARRKWVSHAVGTGIVPRADVDTKNGKKTAMAAWDAFVDNCDPEGLVDFYGLQARVMSEVFTGGACFIRWYLRPPSWGLKVPLQCEVLGHEFLDTRRFQLNGQNLVIHGIEFDPDGRRVAYWLFREHPGEVLPSARSMLVSDRVPATEVDHIFFPIEEAGLVTGMPWLIAAALRLRDIADGDEAILLRHKIAACLAVLVRRQGGAARALAQAADQSKDSKSRDIEKLRPGMIGYVESDGDVTIVNPPNAGDTEFVDRNLYAAAAAVGLTHSALTGNLKDVNFTSLREGKLDFWPALDQVQWFMLVPMACKPAWRRVMAAAAGRGLQVSADTGAKWSPPKRPWVNPADDMKAEAGELAMGFESWADKVAARGHDPQDLLDEIEEWTKKLAAAGLSPTTPAGIAGDRLQQQNGDGGQSGGQQAAKPAAK